MGTLGDTRERAVAEGTRERERGGEELMGRCGAAGGGAREAPSPNEQRRVTARRSSSKDGDKEEVVRPKTQSPDEFPRFFKREDERITGF